ncbi:MAG: proteinase inhibitor I4 serpin [Geobacter sp.]|nr:proteinase inhibitor I4 serpin [Geobacter sp.]
MKTRCFTLFIAMLLLTATGPTLLSAADVLPDRCRQVPVKGPCKAMIEKFFFDQQTGKCKPYFYGGCGQPPPFDTLEECRKLCEERRPEPKKEPSTGLYYDPIEDDPRYADVFKKINDEVKETLAGDPRKGSMGFVHTIWSTKQRILKQKYNIDWRTPAELNPHVMFD